MRTLVDNLRAQLSEFIEQREDLILLLKGDQAGTTISVNILRELEQDPGTDVFLIVSGVFGDARSIADAVVDQARAELSLAAEYLQESDGEPLPELPEDIDDLPPLEKIHSILTYTSGLLDPEGNHRVVLGLFPNSILQPDEYHGLIKDLSPTGGIQAWMRGARLIFCDHSAAELETLEGCPRMRVVDYDLTHDGIQRSLYEDVENQDLPDADRVNAAYQLAIFDHAYDRPDEALEKLDYLLGYFQGTENEVMQAMVMHTTGDVYRKQNNLSRARYWYECATVPAINANSRQTLQKIVQSLGELEHEDGNESKAQAYLAQTRSMANVNGDAMTMIQAERSQAATYQAMGQLPEATATLEQTAHRCRGLGLDFELQLTLQQLVPMYEEQESHSQRDAAVAELERLQSAEVIS